MRVLEITDQSPGYFSATPEIVTLRPDCILGKWFFETLVPVLRSSDPDLTIVINANLSCEGLYSLQECAGIELVFFTRLSGRAFHARAGNPIVVYSFESCDTIIQRQPRYVVLKSEGVRFARLPAARDIGKVAAAKLEDLRRFKPFVQAHYQAPESDHDFSNWWGAYRLLNALRAADSQRHPEALVEDHQSYRRLEILEAMFLHPDAPEPGAGQTGKSIRESLTMRKNLWENAGKRPRVVHVDDEMHEGWNTAVPAAIYGPDAGIPDEYKPIGRDVLEADDAALTNTTCWIIDQDPDLAIIDLRLQRISDRARRIDETSGALLITKLRERAPGLPILLATASNKAWTYREMIKIGANSYWMKEGISDHMPEGGTMANAARLRQILGLLLGRKYQLLRRLGSTLQVLERKGTNHWWSSKRWDPARYHHQTFPRSGRVNSREVFTIVRSLITLLRDYLWSFEMKENEFGTISGAVRHILLGQMLVQVGKAVELIHDWPSFRNARNNGNDKHVAFGQVLRARLDYIGWLLFESRHKGAHLEPDSEKSLDSFEESVFTAICLFMTWISASEPFKQSKSRTWRALDVKATIEAANSALWQKYVALYGDSEIQLPNHILPVKSSDR
jgi:CheY-like chemotaxis protein